MKILLITGFTLITLTICAANARAQTVSSLDNGTSLRQTNPPSLISFGAAKITNSALISWKIKNESDSTSFGVEKSIDIGKTFQPIGTVRANGSGIYSFADNRPTTGQDQYRLKIQDGLSNSSYSNTLILLFQQVNMAANNDKFSPNPTTNSIDLDTATGDDYLDMSPVSTQ